MNTCKMLPVLASIYSASVRKLSCALYMNEAAWYNGKNTGLVVKDKSYSPGFISY